MLHRSVRRVKFAWQKEAFVQVPLDVEQGVLWLRIEIHSRTLGMLSGISLIRQHRKRLKTRCAFRYELVWMGEWRVETSRANLT